MINQRLFKRVGEHVMSPSLWDQAQVSVNSTGWDPRCGDTWSGARVPSTGARTTTPSPLTLPSSSTPPPTSCSWSCLPSSWSCTGTTPGTAAMVSSLSLINKQIWAVYFCRNSCGLASFDCCWTQLRLFSRYIEFTWTGEPVKEETVQLSFS